MRKAPVLPETHKQRLADLKDWGFDLPDTIDDTLVRRYWKFIKNGNSFGPATEEDRRYGLKRILSLYTPGTQVCLKGRTTRDLVYTVIQVYPWSLLEVAEIKEKHTDPKHKPPKWLLPTSPYAVFLRTADNSELLCGLEHVRSRLDP